VALGRKAFRLLRTRVPSSRKPLAETKLKKSEEKVRSLDHADGDGNPVGVTPVDGFESALETDADAKPFAEAFDQRLRDLAIGLKSCTDLAGCDGTVAEAECVCP